MIHRDSIIVVFHVQGPALLLYIVLTVEQCLAIHFTAKLSSFLDSRKNLFNFALVLIENHVSYYSMFNLVT